MIQILGLRDFVDRNGKRKKTTRFFQRNWRFERVEDVFDEGKLNALIQTIPEAERYNLYFTVADCFEEQERKLHEQWAIPFDIDGVTLRDGYLRDDAIAVARVACEAIGVPFEECGAIFSGHGIQLFVGITYAIRSEDYFDEVREHYGAVCERINGALRGADLEGKADGTVWSAARLMRLPNTENRKPDKPIRTAFILNPTMTPRPYNLVEASGLKNFTNAEFIPETVLRQYPKPDTQAVLEGCEFMKRNSAKPAEVNEPEWYADTSVRSRLDNGRELVHLASEGHPGYNFDETELKIEQALKTAGPRTCKDINQRWQKCHTCPHWGKVTSPIMLRGENYIASEDFGFRIMIFKQDEKPRPGRPAYQDLIKFFQKKHPFMTIEGGEMIYIYNGKFWESMSDTKVNEWMTNIVRPHPMGAEMAEFLRQLKAVNVRSLESLMTQRQYKMNFQNYALDLRTMIPEPHKPEHGFLNILPFNYDPMAQAPRWLEFLNDSLEGDGELIQLLEEYGGYCISGDSCWAQRALFLFGDGANGKSLYLEILGEVAGHDAHSVVPLQDLEEEKYRFQLIGKLFNYSEETSTRALAETATLKAIVGGGKIIGRQVYGTAVEFVNTAKLVMSANNPPMASDRSHGLYRRLLIVPFNVRFNKWHPKFDPFLKQKLMTELPGICNRLIAAYNTMKARQEFISAKKSEILLEKYKEDSDNVKRFLLEKCDVLPKECEDSEVKDEVFQAYVMFCRNSEERPLSNVWFWRQMRRHVPDIDDRESKPHRALRIIKGIRLTDKDI